MCYLLKFSQKNISLTGEAKVYHHLIIIPKKEDLIFFGWVLLKRLLVMLNWERCKVKGSKVIKGENWNYNRKESCCFEVFVYYTDRNNIKLFNLRNSFFFTGARSEVLLVPHFLLQFLLEGALWKEGGRYRWSCNRGLLSLFHRWI